MKCPVCKDVSLVMSDRQGVEIDYCPSCRGVWLDRGELDKIIERSAVASNHTQNSYQERRPEKEHYSKYDNDTNHNGYHKKKKESFLADMFDF